MEVKSRNSSFVIWPSPFPSIFWNFSIGSFMTLTFSSAFTINLKMNTEIFAYPGSQDFHSTRRWLHLLFVCFSQQLWYQLWFESNFVQFSDKLKNLSPGWVRILVLSSGKIKWLWHTVCRISLILRYPSILNLTETSPLESLSNISKTALQFLLSTAVLN